MEESTGEGGVPLLVLFPFGEVSAGFPTIHLPCAFSVSLFLGASSARSVHRGKDEALRSQKGERCTNILRKRLDN